MGDKIVKALNKLKPKDRKRIKKVLIQIKKGDISSFDVKKLKGYRDIFRIRIGKIRILIQMKDKNIFILAIEKRTDRTYKQP